MKYLPAILALAIASGLLAAGCGGDGYSTQEANEICKDQANRGLIDEEVLNLCIVCYEACADCALESTSPATFTCPEDE